MKRKDFILIILLLIIAGGFFAGNKILNSKKGNIVRIYVNNKLVKELALNKEEKIEINDKKNKNVIWIHNNGVEMTEANCPDKVCVNTGFINKPGQSIVCLPHKINIKIESEDSMETPNIMTK